MIVKNLEAEIKVALRDVGIVQFNFSAITKGGCINSQVKVYCLLSKMKANSD